MIKQLTIATALLFALVGEAAAQFCAVPSAPPQSPPQNPPPPVCQSKLCNKCTTSPCYPAFGIYTTEAIDLSIHTTGPPLTVTRQYDSSRAVDGPSGIGWFSGLTPRLYYATYLFSAPSTYTHEVDINMPDGFQDRFNANADGTFSAPPGRFDTLVKNADGTYTLSLQRSTSKLKFNADGTLSSMSDDYGNTIGYSYDAAGRTQRVADNAGSGRYLDVTWDTSTGRISMVTDSAGRQVKYLYNADGTLRSAADPVASQASVTSVKYTYTPGRFVPLLSSVSDRWNRTISQLTWDSNDRLGSYTDGAYFDNNPAASPGEKYRYEYHPNGVPGDSRPFTIKSDSYQTTVYYYSPNGLVNSHATYDGNGLPSSVSDDFGSSSFTYDSSGRVSTMTRGNVQWVYTYDATYPTLVSTLIPSQTNWAGYKTEYVAVGTNGGAAVSTLYRYRTDRTTLDRVAMFQYDSAGRVISSTDDFGVATVSSYNAAGDLVSTGIPGFTSNTYDHDSLGRVTRVTDNAGRSRSYTYDDDDRILTMTLPAPHAGASPFTTTYTYDLYDTASGLVFDQQTDPNGQVTRRGYDALGHVQQLVDALGNTTSFTYRYNLLSSVSDPYGNTTSYAYDNNRNLRTTTFPDGTTETTVIVGSTVQSRTDRRGVTTSYAYDTFGRITAGPGAATYDGQNVAGSSGHTYTYDTSYRVLTDTLDSGDKITYTYAGGGASTHFATYSVAPPTGVTAPTQTVTYNYDSAGRIGGINWSYGPAFTVSRTPTGRYSSIGTPIGSRTYTYDNQDRLLTVDDPVTSFSYGYDENWSGGPGTFLGLRTSVNAGGPAAMQHLGLTKYQYDAAYRLTRADYQSGFDAWTYDAIGNRLTHATPSWTFNYTYYKNGSNPNNGQRLATDGATNGSYTYDGNGNVTGTNVSPSMYVWDSANLLTQDLLTGSTFGYDFLGRRTLKTLSGVTTRYVPVGFNTVRERNTSTNAIIDYLFAPGIDEPLARRNADGTINYFSVDGLGSVVAVSNGSGAVQEAVNYSPWGELLGSWSSLFGYTGREQASASLWNYRARHYQPLTGRFMSEDPRRYAEGINFYTYVQNNPTDATDPSGMQLYQPGPQPPNLAPPGCNAGPWHFDHEQVTDLGNKGLWRLVKSYPLRIPLPIAPASPTPAPFTGFCLCFYELAGSIHSYERWEIFTRTIACQPCLDPSSESVRTNPMKSSVLEPTIFSWPAPQMMVLGLFNPAFYKCMCQKEIYQ